MIGIATEPSLIGEWPFVGRDREAGAITAVYAAGGAGVLVVGDAGVGRTRLASEVLARLASAGDRIDWVTATRAAAAIPFAAVARLLPGGDLDGDPLTIFRRAIEHNPGRAALVVDDAHLLDDASAALVHHLVTGSALTVLLTARAGQDSPDAITALWKDGVVVRTDLDPLAEPAIDELIEATLDGPLDGLGRRALHRMAAGNPLLLRELLNAGLHTADLRFHPAGMWHYRGPVRITPRLADLAGERLDARPDDQARPRKHPGTNGKPVCPHRTILLDGDYQRCLALLLAGRLQDALRLTDAGYREAVGAGAAAAAGDWCALRGILTVARGALPAAVAALREAVVLVSERDPHRMSPLHLAELAGALALSGDPAAARDWLDRADSGTRCALLGPWIERNRAWTEAAAGDTSAGAGHALTAADLAAATGQPGLEVLARYDAARLGDPAVVRHRLTELADLLAGPVPWAMARAAAGLADADAEPLDEATTAFTGHGLYLLAAETATAAAALHRQTGRPIRAARSAEQAGAVRVRCPGAHTPLLLAADSVGGLTRRERDVSLLAATGLSSRVIAERLRLSVRTVDNHLGRAYTKLGVTGRRELGRLLDLRPVSEGWSEPRPSVGS